MATFLRKKVVAAKPQQHNERTNLAVKRTVSHGTGTKLQGGKRDWAFRPKKFKCYTIDPVIYTESLRSTHRAHGAAE